MKTREQKLETLKICRERLKKLVAMPSKDTRWANDRNKEQRQELEIERLDAKIEKLGRPREGYAWVDTTADACYDWDMNADIDYVEGRSTAVY